METTAMDLNNGTSRKVETLAKVQTSTKVRTSAERPLEMKVETITPAMAKGLLESSTRNRSIKKGRVDQWAKAMEEHVWKLNGESIIIDWNGQLADGHHRCLGCMQADVPFISVVVRGVDPACFATTDIGVARHGGDMATIAGYQNANALAAAAKILIARDCGHFHGATAATPAQVLAKLQASPHLLEWIGPCSKTPQRFIPISLVTAMFTLFAEKHGTEYPSTFLNAIIDGEGLRAGDPALTLRNRIFADRAASKLHGANGRNASAHLLASAWKFFIRGESVSKLMLPAKLEQFPVIA